MKKSLFLCAILALFFLNSCESTIKHGEKSPNTIVEIINYKSSADENEAETIAWLEKILNSQKAEIPSAIQEKIDSNNERNYSIVRICFSKNEPLLEQNVPESLFSEIAETVNRALDARYNGILLFDEESQDVLSEAAKNADFVGFNIMEEKCAFVREQDLKSAKTRNFYAFVQIFSCPYSLWLKNAESYIKNLGFCSGNADLKDAASYAEEIARSIENGVIFATNSFDRTESELGSEE